MGSSIDTVTAVTEMMFTAVSPAARHLHSDQHLGMIGGRPSKQSHQQIYGFLSASLRHALLCPRPCIMEGDNDWTFYSKIGVYYEVLLL